MPLASEYRASFAYTAKVARRVYLAMLWRRFDGLVIATPILFVWAWLNVDSPQYASLAGFGLGAIAAFWFFWIAGLRRAGEVATRAGSPEVSLVFNDEGFTSQSAHVVTVSKWAAISAILKTRSFLIFVRAGAIYASFVPTAALPPGAGEFIVDQVRKAGGRVG
jgi:hypothetical protein